MSDPSAVPHISAIVDRLADELDRFIVVEDRRMRLLAFSPHHGPLDPLRERSVLTRETPSEVIAWMTDLGVFESTAPVRVGAMAELGAKARVMTPIRWEGSLIGFLATLDPEQSLDEADLARLDETSRRLAGHVHRAMLLERGIRPRERELLEVLLDDAHPDARRRAGANLVSEGFLREGPTLALVVTPMRRDDDVDLALLVDQVAAHVRRRLPRGTVAATAHTGRAIFVAAADRRSDPGRAGGDLALRAHTALRDLLPGDVRSALLVTYGSSSHDFAEVATSFEQASLTAAVARAARELRPVLGWAELGVYQTLAQSALTGELSTDAEQRLGDLDAKPDLLLTLETYLEYAGDAKRTAGQLNLHRASLYYRLNRIEEILGIDLKSGEDRLETHLALKARRLRRRRPSDG